MLGDTQHNWSHLIKNLITTTEQQRQLQPVSKRQCKVSETKEDGWTAETCLLLNVSSLKYK